MPRTPTRNPRLQDRDGDILEHVMRYRMTTPEVLHRHFFDDSLPNAVTKVTSRLTAHGFLLSHPLFGNQTYFGLGINGAKVMGLSLQKVGPLGPQALFTEFGILNFCCLGPVRRERCRVGELIQHNPELVAQGADRSHYYLDTEENVTRIGFIRVDGGGDVAHLIRKIRQDIDVRTPVPAFRQLIDDGRFLIAIVTFSDQKRDAVAQELQKINTRVLFRVESVAQLRQLLPRHA